MDHTRPLRGVTKSPLLAAEEYGAGSPLADVAAVRCVAADEADAEVRQSGATVDGVVVDRDRDARAADAVEGGGLRVEAPPLIAGQADPPEDDRDDLAARGDIDVGLIRGRAVGPGELERDGVYAGGVAAAFDREGKDGGERESQRSHGRQPIAQSGDVDLNGELVGRLRQVQRERVRRLEAAIGEDNAVDVESQLAAVLRMIPSSRRAAAWSR